MVQWINVLQNNSFVNPMRLPLLCRNSRAVALAKPGLTAGWLTAFKLVFSAKACFNVVVRSVKIREAIVFLVDPY